MLPIHNLHRLSVPTIYVQIQFPSTNSFLRIIFMNSLSRIFFYKFNITNSFSRIIFMNSLSRIFFYKFNIMNSFSRINFPIHKYSKKFIPIHRTLFWFVFAKSMLSCKRPVLQSDIRGNYKNMLHVYTNKTTI